MSFDFKESFIGKNKLITETQAKNYYKLLDYKEVPAVIFTTGGLFYCPSILDKPAYVIDHVDIYNRTVIAGSPADLVAATIDIYGNLWFLLETNFSPSRIYLYAIDPKISTEENNDILFVQSIQAGGPGRGEIDVDDNFNVLTQTSSLLKYIKRLDGAEFISTSNRDDELLALDYYRVHNINTSGDYEAYDKETGALVSTVPGSPFSYIRVSGSRYENQQYSDVYLIENNELTRIVGPGGPGSDWTTAIGNITNVVAASAHYDYVFTCRISGGYIYTKLNKLTGAVINTYSTSTGQLDTIAPKKMYADDVNRNLIVINTNYSINIIDYDFTYDYNIELGLGAFSKSNLSSIACLMYSNFGWANQHLFAIKE